MKIKKVTQVNKLMKDTKQPAMQEKTKRTTEMIMKIQMKRFMSELVPNLHGHPGNEYLSEAAVEEAQVARGASLKDPRGSPRQEFSPGQILHF